jgi:hypothetical protein
MLYQEILMKPPPNPEQTTPVRRGVISYNGSDERPRKTLSSPAEPIDTASGACPPAPVTASDSSTQSMTSATQRQQELAKLIVQLWNGHESRTEAVAHEKGKLAASLSEYKSLFAKKGRNGKWAAFLRDQKIPLSTADHYVSIHRRAAAQGVIKRVEQDSHVVTPAQITGIVKKTVTALTKKLKTGDDINSFLTQFNDAMSRCIPTAPNLSVN